MGRRGARASEPRRHQPRAVDARPGEAALVRHGRAGVRRALEPRRGRRRVPRREQVPQLARRARDCGACPARRAGPAPATPRRAARGRPGPSTRARASPPRRRAAGPRSRRRPPRVAPRARAARRSTATTVPGRRLPRGSPSTRPSRRSRRSGSAAADARCPAAGSRPAASSKNAASCSPSAEAQAAHTSIPVPPPRPALEPAQLGLRDADALGELALCQVSGHPPIAKRRAEAAREVRRPIPPGDAGLAANGVERCAAWRDGRRRALSVDCERRQPITPTAQMRRKSATAGPALRPRSASPR